MAVEGLFLRVNLLALAIPVLLRSFHRRSILELHFAGFRSVGAIHYGSPLKMTVLDIRNDIDLLPTDGFDLVKDA